MTAADAEPEQIGDVEAAKSQKLEGKEATENSLPVLNIKRCPKMSHLEDLPTSTQIRIPTIKYGKLHGWTQTQIAESCGVSRRTIYRTICDWVKTDDFLEWAREIFVAKIGKVSDKEALRAATNIITKGMASKAEIKAELKSESTETKVIMLDPEDRALLESAARSYIKTGNKTESASIH